MPTDIVIYSALGILVLAIVVINDRQKERAVRRAEAEQQRPPGKYLNYRTSWGMVVVLLIGFASIPFLGPIFRYLNRVRNFNDWILDISVALAGAIILLSIGIYIFARWKHRIIYRAMKMAKAGDVPGAIALLEDHMKEKGRTALHCYNQAILHGILEQWDAAVRVIEEAESLPDWQAVFFAAKGMALRKIGRVDEALSCLRKAVLANPENLMIGCQYGMLLAETGNRSEALEVLRQADHLFSSQGGYWAADRRARENALEEFRRKMM